MTGGTLVSLRMPAVKRSGAPDAGNPHVRCDEGKGRASARSFLLYRSFPRIKDIALILKTVPAVLSGYGAY